jgi:hypothetical protein
MPQNKLLNTTIEMTGKYRSLTGIYRSLTGQNRSEPVIRTLRVPGSATLPYGCHYAPVVEVGRDIPCPAQIIDLHRSWRQTNRVRASRGIGERVEDGQPEIRLAPLIARVIVNPKPGQGSALFVRASVAGVAELLDTHPPQENVEIKFSGLTALFAGEKSLAQRTSAVAVDGSGANGLAADGGRRSYRRPTVIVTVHTAHAVENNRLRRAN